MFINVFQFYLYFLLQNIAKFSKQLSKVINNLNHQLKFFFLIFIIMVFLIAILFLLESEVERPASGPAAKIEIPGDEYLRNYPIHCESIELPSSLLGDEAISSSVYNQIQNPKPPHVIPKIIICDAEQINLNNNNYEPIRVQETKKIINDITTLSTSNNNISNDNVMDSTPNIPALSLLLESEHISRNTPILSTSNNNTSNENNVSNSEPNIPALSMLLESENISGNIPALSQLMNQSSMESNNSDNIPALSILQSEASSYNIPNLSILNQNSEALPSEISSVDELNENIPAFSKILNTEHSIISNIDSLSDIPHLLHDLDNLRISPVQSSGSNSTRSCASLLPNLTLKTVLPQFNYILLEQCTNNFNDEIVNTQEAVTVETKERKLGSGAFGSVYLAIGLLDTPVAVKKLNLNGVDVVNIDDTITKQFRNEVELLCKYKHENLLTLLGYSCDGPTYCLIYEYISGGALKDRLEGSLLLTDPRKLFWTDRLYVALGTAKAVSYLHSAYSTPLIHRDIKSANILLDNSNKPKVIIFNKSP